MFLPQYIHLLITPVFALGAEFDVEVVEKFGEDETHFCPGEVLSNTVSGSG